MNSKNIQKIGYLSAVALFISSVMLKDDDKAKEQEKKKNRRNLSFVVLGATLIYQYVSNQKFINKANSYMPSPSPMRIKRTGGPKDTLNAMEMRNLNK
jgi:NADH:ubiquinone oxidoreductase subunit 6 (subunit J)